VLNGRPAIEKDFDNLFAENKGLKLRIEIASLKFPTPDTAVEDGTTAVLAPDGTAPSRARYSNFFVKTYHGTTSGGARYHGAYSTGGYGAYRYGGSYGGGGFHAAAVSGPNGTAYAAGVYRRRVW
jgi:hypothetical protein